MTPLFLQYPACSTCQKAKKWLIENNIEYTNRLIVEDNPTVEELKAWIPRSGLPIKKFFNTSGLVYKELKLSEKLPSMTLLIYVGLIGLAMGIFHVNLSLSGIAGIVLSIGMAVDADCIIFERMKEELKVGKTIRASVSAGFDKAFSAILDSNITTIISCVVLYISGIGAVTGFATTLGIGVILSMFTAIVITKFLLKQLVGIGIENRSLFYNAKAKKGGAEE